MSEQQKPFDHWAIVEVMGHRSFGGRVTEQSLGGTSFVRVDVPSIGEKPAFTKLFGASAIYGISPVTEEVARLYQERRGSEPPIQEYDLPESVRRAIYEGQKVLTAQPAQDSDLDDDPGDDVVGDDW